MTAPPVPSTLATLTGGAQVMYRPAGGTTDDAPRIQALVTSLNAKYGGGTVLLGPGHYLIKTRLDLQHVAIKGCEPTPSVYDKNNIGVVVFGNSAYVPGIANATCRLDITADEDNASAESPLLLRGNASVSDVVIYYPNLGADPGAGDTPPHDYPFTFHIMHESKIENVGVFVCRRFAKLEGRRPRLLNCYGSATDVGVSLDNSQDCARVSDVHFAPNIGGGAYSAYIAAHLTAFDIRRCDGAIFNGCFCYSCSIGFMLRNGDGRDNVNAPWAVFTNCGVDVATTSCVTVNATQGQGCRFSNCFFTSASYDVVANSGVVNFNGCSFLAVDNLGSPGCLYNGGGAASTLNVTGCNLFNVQGNGTMLTCLAGSRTILKDCLITTGWTGAWGKIFAGAHVVYAGNTSLGVQAFVDGTGAAINLSALPAGFQYGTNFNNF